MINSLVNQKRSSLWVLGVIGFTILFFCPSVIHAYTITSSSVDDREDFVVEPAKQEIILDPGQTDTRYVYVTSRIKEPTTFQVDIEDIIGSQDPNRPVVLLGADKSPYSLKDYLLPDTRQFTLKFGEKIQIPVKINLPATAAPGGFYAAVVISNAPSKLEASSSQNIGTKTISRIGSLFLVRINGPVNQSGHLTDFKIKNPQWVYQKADLSFQIYFQNEGNVHLVPYGDIVIKNLWGQEVADLPVDAYFSLPTSLRYREIPWLDDSAFGRYTATVYLHRGYGNTIDQKSISFWIIPWRILIGVFLGIVILVSLVYFFIRNFEFRKR